MSTLQCRRHLNFPMHWGKTDFVRYKYCTISEHCKALATITTANNSAESAREKKKVESIGSFLSQPCLHMGDYPCLLQWNEFLGGPAQ